MNTEETFDALDKKFAEFFKVLDNYTEESKEIENLPDGVMKETEKIAAESMANVKTDKIGAEIEKLITDMDGSDFAEAMDNLAAENPECAEKLRELLDECSEEARQAASTDGDLSVVIAKLEEMEKLLKE